MTLEAMLDHVLVAADDDWVGIWEFPWIASSVGGAQNPDHQLKLSLEVIREALEKGFLEVGDVTTAGFRVWGLPPGEACRRIEDEWRRFPNGPRLGDVSCWFNLTSKGKERLEDS